MQDQPDHEDRFLSAIEERTRKGCEQSDYLSRWSSEYTRTALICACSRVAKARCKTKLKSELKRNLSLNRGRGGAAPREGRPGDGGAAPGVQGKGGGRSPRPPHKGLYWAIFYSSGPSFFSSMTKFSSLARARVTGPEGGAWGGGASGGAGEGAAGVDVLEVSSSRSTPFYSKLMN